MLEKFIKKKEPEEECFQDIEEESLDNDNRYDIDVVFGKIKSQGKRALNISKANISNTSEGILKTVWKLLKPILTSKKIMAIVSIVLLDIIFFPFIVDCIISSIKNMQVSYNFHMIFNWVAMFSNPEYLIATGLLHMCILCYSAIKIDDIKNKRKAGLNVYGDAEWQNDNKEEMYKRLKHCKMTDEKINGSGTIVAASAKKNFIDYSDTTPHQIIIGTSGSGKSDSEILPRLMLYSKARESVIVNDPKGEIVKETYNIFKSRGYNCIIFNNEALEYENQYNQMQLINDVMDKVNYHSNVSKACDYILQKLKPIEIGDINKQLINIFVQIKKEVENDKLTSEILKYKRQAILTEILKILPTLEGLETKEAYVEYLTKLREENNYKRKKHESKAITNAKNLVKILIMQFGNEKDNNDFWSKTSTTLLLSAVLFISRESYLDKSRHLGSVFQFLQDYCEIKKDENGNDLKNINEIMDILSQTDFIRRIFKTINKAGEETRASVEISADTYIDLWNIDYVNNQCCDSSIDIYNIYKDPTIIYLVSPSRDEAAPYTVLTSLFVEQCYQAAASVAKREPDGKLPRKLHFVLEEFPQLPPILEMDSKVSMARSKGIDFTIVVQSFEQLKKMYNDAVAEVIKENTGWMYLLSNSKSTREAVAERCGKETVDARNSSESESKTGNSNSYSYNQTGKDLISANELDLLNFGEFIYKEPRRKPIKVYVERFKNYPEHKIREKEGIYDPYVKERGFDTYANLFLVPMDELKPALERDINLKLFDNLPSNQNTSFVPEEDEERILDMNKEIIQELDNNKDNNITHSPKQKPVM